TEPMKNAMRGELLDFSSIPSAIIPEEPMHPAKLSGEARSALLARYQVLRKTISEPVDWRSPVYDDIYFQARNLMDSEDSVIECLPFLGDVTIQREAEISISDQRE
ncbi:MAG: hypothetical protein ABSA18_11240, partial [Dehalococcoidia bacterium]